MFILKYTNIKKNQTKISKKKKKESRTAAMTRALFRCGKPGHYRNECLSYQRT